MPGKNLIQDPIEGRPALLQPFLEILVQPPRLLLSWRRGKRGRGARSHRKAGSTALLSTPRSCWHGETENAALMFAWRMTELGGVFHGDTQHAGLDPKPSSHKLHAGMLKRTR